MPPQSPLEFIVNVLYRRSNATHAVTPKIYGKLPKNYQILSAWQDILIAIASVTVPISRPTRGLRQACNTAFSRLPRSREAGSNRPLCSLRLKHRVDLGTNEFQFSNSTTMRRQRLVQVGEAEEGLIRRQLFWLISRICPWRQVTLYFVFLCYQISNYPFDQPSMFYSS